MDPTCETRQEVRDDLTFHREEVQEAPEWFKAKLSKDSAELQIKELKAKAESTLYSTGVAETKGESGKIREGSNGY